MKNLVVTLALIPALSLAAPKAEKEKCFELQLLAERNEQTLQSYREFLGDYSEMNLSERIEVLTGTTQRVYLRLKAAEKLTGIIADVVVMQKSGDLLNDVIVGGVYTDEQAAEMMKGQITPLSEQMVSVLHKYQDSEAFNRCHLSR